MSKKEKYSKFQELLDEWVTRLSGQHFHGGKGPDAADFKVSKFVNKSQ